ncbi:MAG: DUF6526 family protein [Ferruginibacter sp.]|jgi:hypothetical protein
MKQQYSNHIRLLPLYHGVTFFMILALLAGSVVNVIKSCRAGEGLYSASLLCLVSVILVFLFFFARSFALKAQDRAIRAEENLRYFILTGHLPDSRLSIQQIIALRFASDQELKDLALRAVAENLTPKQIKQAIRHWRGDYHRV